MKNYINDVVNEICICYGLSSSVGKMLLDNITSRSELYKNNKLRLDNNELQVIRNISTVEDFLLNRLICNIRSYDIGKNIDGNKGDFSQETQQLMVSNYDYLSNITQDKIVSRFPTCDSNLIKKSVKKVFNHEVGHALQCNNTGVVGVNDREFNSLIARLSNKYPGIFKNLDELGNEPLRTSKKGMQGVRKDDKYKDARDFYAKNAYTTLLDEIFNETESLEITGINIKQGIYTYGDDYEIDVYNYESSNYRITPYGNMMKILLGPARTFDAMYNDSIIAYSYFDAFESISNEVFGNNYPPVFNILNALNDIKSKKDSKQAIVYAEQLDLFFVKCLELKVSKAITSIDSIEKANLLYEKIRDFKKQMLECKSKQLLSQQIITILETKTKTLINKFSTEALLEELEKDNDITIKVPDGKDDITKLDELANKFSLEQISLVDLIKELNLISNDSELIFNMKNALKDEDIVAYNYWRENYLKPQSNFGSK